MKFSVHEYGPDGVAEFDPFSDVWGLIWCVSLGTDRQLPFEVCHD